MRKTPFWSEVKRSIVLRLTIPVGLLIAVTSGLMISAFQLAETPAPNVLRVEQEGALTPDKGNPYAFSSLLERLPPHAIARVAAYVDYYQNVRKRGLQSGLARSTRYLAIFQRIFRKYGLPEELALLPLIESGFVEHATSPAAAVGVWQFIEETGRQYNLQANAYLDRRRDPINSAVAAAQYLKSLHGQFKDWDLALAAYNAGAGTVRWARRVNRKAELPMDYWALSLPEETENYVPAFIATVLIAKNPNAFGFNKIRFMPEMAYERIKVSPGITLAQLAAQMAVDEADLYALNPELIQGQTPPGDGHYLLRIPPGNRGVLPSRVTGKEAKLKDWVLHRVGQTDTLQTLAARFQAQTKKIRQVNGLENNGDLTLREFVIIPL